MTLFYMIYQPVEYLLVISSLYPENERQPHLLSAKFFREAAGLQLRVHIENYFSYFSTKTYVVGAQKNCLNERFF